jgi:hypothetical protein
MLSRRRLVRRRKFTELEIAIELGKTWRDNNYIYEIFSAIAEYLPYELRRPLLFLLSFAITASPFQNQSLSCKNSGDLLNFRLYIYNSLGSVLSSQPPWHEKEMHQVSGSVDSYKLYLFGLS